MKTTIEDETRIGAVTMFAELAVWRKRLDLQALCAAASEHGVLEEDTVATVLPGLSARACKNILRRLEHDRLVDRQYRLTEFGESCASSGDAPAWEEGVYRFLVAEHELFGVHILDFERDPRAISSGGTGLNDVPDGFAMPRQRMFVSAFDPNLRFGLGADSVAGKRPARCRIERMPEATLRWEIALESGENECIVEGQIQIGGWPRSGKFRSAAESAPSSELSGLFAQWEPRWNAGRGCVAMEYDGGVGPDGQEPFVRKREYGPVRIGRFGEFPKVVVRDIPVGPAEPADAREWAAAIAIARVKSRDQYVTLDRWRSEWSNAFRNPPLAEWAVNPPDDPAAALGGAREARTKWLLSAATDLEATP